MSTVIPSAIFVTPLAGVWIEIPATHDFRGYADVTPLAGVWIEMDNSILQTGTLSGHTPRGCVD